MSTERTTERVPVVDLQQDDVVAFTSEDRTVAHVRVVLWGAVGVTWADGGYSRFASSDYVERVVR